MFRLDLRYSPLTTCPIVAPYYTLAQRTGNLIMHSSNSVLGLVCLDIDLASAQSTRESELARHTFDAVGRVDILDQDDLVASCRSLAGDDGRVSKKKIPDLYVCQHASRTLRASCEFKHTLNHRPPYFAMTFSLFPIQFLYHLQRVAE